MGCSRRRLSNNDRSQPGGRKLSTRSMSTVPSHETPRRCLRESMSRSRWLSTGHTGATHDAFICEACHMWGDIIGNSGAVEIGNVDHGGHGDRAGTHAAVAANAHVDLEAYLFLAEGTQVCAMLNTHDEVACLLFI